MISFGVCLRGGQRIPPSGEQQHRAFYLYPEKAEAHRQAVNKAVQD